MPDRYVTHGKPALLHEEVGFTGRAVARRVADALGVDLGDVLAAELSS
jgi:1-deoxy-D-xylulose-5-phosphate synthase